MEEKKNLDTIESEQKLLDLLGYTAVGPDNQKRYLIFDEKGQEVGFIQRKRLHKRKEKKVIGYVMEIHSDNITCSNVRKINSMKEYDFYDTSFYYEFDIRNKNGNMDHVKLQMNDRPYLKIQSKDYKEMTFELISDKLYTCFISEKEDFKMQEILVVKSEAGSEDKVEYDCSYSYTVMVCNKDQDIDDIFDKLGKKSTEFEAIHRRYYYDGNNDPYVCVNVKEWENGHLTENKQYDIKKMMLPEVIEAHKSDYDPFSHFRYIVNERYPWKEELIGTMLENRGVPEKEFQLFVPDLQKTSSKKNTKKV